MGDTWVGAALVKVESVLVDQNEVGHHLTFEQRRRCFRRREEQHAKGRGDGWGHGGGRVTNLYRQSHIIVDDESSGMYTANHLCYEK